MTHDQTTPDPVDVTALKSCPFCGSADIRHDHPNRAPRVYCGECRVVADCPQRWNTRHSAPAGEVEPVAWMYERRYLGRTTRELREHKIASPSDGWTETPLYPAPPADVVELVEALRRYADQYCELGPYTELCGKLEWDQCSGCLARAALAKHGGA